MKTSSAVGLPLHSMILTFLPAVVLPATEEPVTRNATTSHNLLSLVRDHCAQNCTVSQAANIFTSSTACCGVPRCRRAQQFNKAVENTHRVNRHKQFPLPDKEVPSAGAGKKELVGVDKMGQPTGVEVEADKWHTNYGHLYANKDVADPPGSNQFRLPTKLTSLLGPLEAAEAKQVGHTNSTSNELLCQHMTTFWRFLMSLGKHRNNQHHRVCRVASQFSLGACFWGF